MIKDIIHIPNSEKQLRTICSALIFAIHARKDVVATNHLLQALWDMYCIPFSLKSSISNIIAFDIDTASVNQQAQNIEEFCKKTCPESNRIIPVVSYLLDELMCNIQQHAHSEKGYIFVQHNEDTKTIDIALADNGITIFGSYVRAQRYLDLIGNSDAQALYYAKEGYSTKDLPNAENRGYGLSSNIKMIVEGLQGQFSIISGNALSIFDNQETIVIELPEDIDWNGTLIIARIPLNIPNDFSIYTYII